MLLKLLAEHDAELAIAYEGGWLSRGVVQERALRLLEDLRVDAAGSGARSVVLEGSDTVAWLVGLIACSAVDLPVVLSEPIEDPREQPFGRYILVRNGTSVPVAGVPPKAWPPFNSVPWVAIPSGGTSTTGRWIVHTWESALAGGYRLVTQVRRDLGEVARLLRFRNLLQPNSIGSVTVAAEVLGIGGSMVFATPLWKALGPLGVSNVAASPWHSRKLAHLPGVAWESDLRIVGVGGGHSPSAVLCSLIDRYRCGVVNGYGMTEAGGAVALSDPVFASDQAESLSLLRPLEGVVCSEDDDGMLVLESEYSFLGSLVPSFRDGFNVHIDPHIIASEDAVVFEANDRFRILGRRSVRITKGGRTVHPEFIECRLLSLPGVVSAYAYGRPNRLHPEETDLHADVIVDSHVAGDAIRRSYVASFGADLVPRTIRVVDNIEMTRDGKIRRIRAGGEEL